MLFTVVGAGCPAPDEGTRHAVVGSMVSAEPGGAALVVIHLPLMHACKNQSQASRVVRTEKTRKTPAQKRLHKNNLHSSKSVHY